MVNFLFGDITKDNIIKQSLNLNSLDCKDELCFDFSNSFWFEPFGMLYAGMLIRQFHEKYPNIKYKIKYTPDSSPITYAGHMGFFKFISEKLKFGKLPGEASGNTNYVPITRIDFLKEHNKYINDGNFLVMGEVIEEKSNELSAVISQGNKELEKILS